jgi:hypothetical protein
MTKASDGYLDSQRLASYDDVESPFIPMFRSKSSRPKDRRQSVTTLCIVLAGVSLLSVAAVLFAKPLRYRNAEDAPAYTGILDSQSYVQGPPTQSFRGQWNQCRYPSATSQQLSQITFGMTRSTLHRGFLQDGVRQQYTAIDCTTDHSYLLANDVMTYVSQLLHFPSRLLTETRRI